MVGKQEKQMKAVVIRQRQSSDLPDERDCRHVPKCVQAPDMQKLFLITGFISFRAPPPILHLSIWRGRHSRTQINSRCSGKPRKTLPFQARSQKAELVPGPWSSMLLLCFLGQPQVSHPKLPRRKRVTEDAPLEGL